MKISYVLFIFLFSIQLVKSSTDYPVEWWLSEGIDKSKVADWEILPDKGEIGKTVILSKRNELGILSNFAPTPVKYENKKYASLEGAWQSMKYPEGRHDNRYGSDTLPHTREQVEQMSGFEAKKAGGLASKLMKKYGVNFVSYKGKKIIYRTKSKGEHYKLIRNMMQAKLNQNKEVESILKSTGKLILLPDHHYSGKYVPPAWKYYEIWMDIRENL